MSHGSPPLVGATLGQDKALVAAKGVAVISVEFRNSAGGRVYGPDAPLAPFPAGLNDAMAGLVHIHERREELRIGTIVLNGESGGGNLACALAILAKRQGRPQMVDGVYANCPFIAGDYLDEPSSYRLEQLPPPTSAEELRACEALHAALDLYRWLARRFPQVHR